MPSLLEAQTDVEQKKERKKDQGFISVIIIMVVIIIMGASCFFLASEAGYLGTTDGKTGTWKDRYRELKQEIEQINQDKQIQIAIADQLVADARYQTGVAQAERDQWIVSHQEMEEERDQWISEFVKMRDERDQWISDYVILTNNRDEWRLLYINCTQNN